MADPLAPVDLARHYSRFRVAERLLLTGHSHQAWPDVGFEAQQQAWLDAADRVDDKWEKAALVAEDVRAGFRHLLNDPDGDIALGQNTHELIVRWLSAVLPMFGCTRPTHPGRVITTDGEFHTIRRQLDRLAEEGVEVVKLPARPVETLAERIVATVTETTACVMVSSVLFETAEIVPGLDLLADTCAARDVALLVDAYHHVNVVPFDIEAQGLSRAFVVGGGYKYCQLGEGNCFLRVPSGCDLRPVLTGWFSEFAELAAPAHAGDTCYGRGAARFAGATYDPSSHYRAAAVFAFHRAHGLEPAHLRGVSQHQVGRLADRFQALDVDPRIASLIAMPAQGRAGFLAIQSPHASDLASDLRHDGVFSDARGDVLRLGPAPYLEDRQLDDAMVVLGDAISRTSR